ncbi:putative family transcriptional regulator protein [Botrytis fragariae]|uniref:Putative family transcriptional regulator protein n=1 Tax=Botrytis fragariae TaxID=1964551 RepID=A0A8H6EML7_9HELO|nr:putative family transcriptional regulator protein [Botrytis fragariae]KAF5877664.1 putative family transcriptional regulator protein [Botrytis fragariae]
MAVSLYDISVVPFIKSLKTLSTSPELLAKGQAHFEDESKIINAKLIDDMGDLIFQVQRVSDSAKGLAVRVAGAESVALEDNEKDFAGLYTRINRTIEILEALPSTSTDGKEDTEVVLKLPSGDLKFTAKDYVLNFAIPNFYFHVVTAYNILRKEGVPVGKFDFLGRGN